MYISLQHFRVTVFSHTLLKLPKVRALITDVTDLVRRGISTGEAPMRRLRRVVASKPLSPMGKYDTYMMMPLNKVFFSRPL